MKNTYPTVEHVQKTTAFKTKTHAQGAIEALKWLEAGAPHKFDGLKGTFAFDMGCFIDPLADWQKNAACGTACCIAGAIHAFSKKMNGDKKKNIAVESMSKIFNTAANGDLHNLFYGIHENQSLPLEEVTSEDAATTLRKYLEEGVVDWSEFYKKMKEKYTWIS